jgi:N-acetylglutamate synthase-like GNAT family acetyltransferase/enamine deaminase RidA (YjgF/YER057c/UK114 family)
MERTHIASGAPWETVIGYSRLVKVGRQVFVTGTSALLPDGTLDGWSDGVGDPYKQAVRCLRNIEAALAEVGGTLDDVVRTRMFLTDLRGHWEEVGRAHRELLGHVRPATNIVEVGRMLDDRTLVLIEADALIGAGTASVISERLRISEPPVSATASIAELFKSAGLPSPADERALRLLAAYRGEQIVGCVGYERHGSAALMLSLVVVERAQGGGVGHVLVQSLLGRLKSDGVREVYLLAPTSARFFTLLGFETVSHVDVAPEVRALTTFAENADDAACMRVTF